ncbi:RNA polymerase sigma factor, partial [Curtobacterium sp. MCBA15_005]|uniref:RNA polymerase sigma factor n=1 Tax=Curtobacterium sp. MCBA15_005 TaxID=1898734 RepID=UPI0020C84C45
MDQIDPEDLLSEALVRLVEKWASGNGPSEHVNAYVIRSMRNRVIDELRSPRSKTDAVEDEQLDTLVGAD